jgi:hypothetical protein
MKLISLRLNTILFTILFIILMIFPPNYLSNITLSNNFNSKVVSSPTIIINTKPFESVYEGDIINCTIEGDVTKKYWVINNQSQHDEFIDDNPIIFNPEPTPLNEKYVDLTVYVENVNGSASDTIPIKLYKIFFGDLHWHSSISDGQFSLDEMYGNTIQDNYLDFTACVDHGELIDGFNTKFGYVPETDWIKTLLQKLLRISEWDQMKTKANEYNIPGSFTTFLGFEWTAAQWSIGGRENSPHKWEDVSHINFYYKDVYQDSREYADWQRPNYDSILNAMGKEWDKGHHNIGFPHHSQGKASWASFSTNFSFLANDISNIKERNMIIRGAEIYSRWGNSIGQYYTPNFPWTWSYPNESFYNQTDAWLENACWEWSKEKMRNQNFVFISSSDTHDIDRAGSASINESHLSNPSGLVGVYSIHNTREEIWDGLYNCSCYALQLLKQRVNVRINGYMSYGQWINCSSPLEIRITAQSTFPGLDFSGKNMKPHGFDNDLDYQISDIWLIKKDNEKGRPWCKIINHTNPNNKSCVIIFTDSNIQTGDFYWIAIKQKNRGGNSDKNDFMSYIGPFFINVINQYQ